MIIQSKKIWLANQFFPCQLEVVNQKIIAIHEYGLKPVDDDYGDLRIVPGFIDVHCHGAYRFDTNDANPEGLRKWTKNIVTEGVTSFLATTITQSEEVLTKALKNVAKVVAEGYEGAQILGVHFEGPYLSVKFKGAQPEEHIVKPSIDQFIRYQKAANGLIKYITVAPEEDQDFEFIKYLSRNGVVVSLGHSNATYEEAVLAYGAGARSMTHVYNGMSPFNHRANGLVGAAYRIRNMYGEIICDGHHSTPAALNNYFKAKGPDYAIMVTDCLMCKGEPAGTKFMFGGHEIRIMEDGTAHLTETDTIAGSTLKVNEGLRVLVEDALVDFTAALNSCTQNPANCLGLKNKGRIGVDYDADLVVLDKDYKVVQTYVLGQKQL